MSSPSRPASHALTTSSTSSRASCLETTLICLRERSSRTTSLKRSGTMGRSAIRQLLYFVSYASGSASCTRWPTAHVITFCGPSRKPSYFWNGPSSTRARSCPTEGFSAITSVFDIAVRVAGAISATTTPGAARPALMSLASRPRTAGEESGDLAACAGARANGAAAAGPGARGRQHRGDGFVRDPVAGWRAAPHGRREDGREHLAVFIHDRAAAVSRLDQAAHGSEQA